MKKYELLKEDTVDLRGTILYRIRALRDISENGATNKDIKAGELGGYIQTEDNLSQEDGCWVYPGSFVYENARIFGRAQIGPGLKIFGNAQIGLWFEYFGVDMYHLEIGGDAKLAFPQDIYCPLTDYAPAVTFYVTNEYGIGCTTQGFTGSLEEFKEFTNREAINIYEKTYRERWDLITEAEVRLEKRLDFYRRLSAKRKG